MLTARVSGGEKRKKNCGDIDDVVDEAVNEHNNDWLKNQFKKKGVIMAATTSSVLPEDRYLNEGIKEDTILNTEKYIPSQDIFGLQTSDHRT